MTELERRLARLAGELDWPPSPELAPRVTERLRSAGGAAVPAVPGRSRARPRLPVGRPLAIALAALLLLAATVAAIPPVRDAVLEVLGLQGATVERREALPPVPPGSERLDLGRRVTLERAGRLLGFEPLLPAGLPAPDAVHVQTAIPGGELSLSYRPRAGLPEASTTGLGLLVTEFRGDLHPDHIRKLTGTGTRVERLRIGGRRAIWIEGAPHFVGARLAANVLLLEHGDVLVRLEGAFGRQRALALASLNP